MEAFCSSKDLQHLTAGDPHVLRVSGLLMVSKSQDGDWDGIPGPIHWGTMPSAVYPALQWQSW